MAQLRHEIPKMIERGAAPAIVGCGKVHHLAWFLEDQKPDVPCYTDPTQRVHQLAELKHGHGNRLKMLKRGAAAFAAGHRQVGIKGDPEQQGGVFVVRPGGHLVWTFRAQFTGDQPDPDEIIRQL